MPGQRHGHRQAGRPAAHHEDVGAFGQHRFHLRHFVRRWEADGTLVALLRAAATNPGAADRMRGIFSGQLAAAVARSGADAATAERRAGLVASQILGLALTRYVVRLPPVVDLDPEELTAWVGPTIQRYLTQPLPPSRASGR
ncbi:hypothetical protein ACIODS_03020 [Micromonospora chalcea]|uniref:TetR/AcrR family transcriptional regulator n=1 Tax=Micromonospora chalcea TaxID=1874 RepID=UPI003805FE02